MGTRASQFMSPSPAQAGCRRRPNFNTQGCRSPPSGRGGESVSHNIRGGIAVVVSKEFFMESAQQTSVALVAAFVGANEHRPVSSRAAFATDKR